MFSRAFYLLPNFKRRRARFLAALLLCNLFFISWSGLAEKAQASNQMCDITTTFNVVNPGTTITISWQTEGYTQAKLNGEAVSPGSGAQTFTIIANATYTLVASNGPSQSSCTVSATIFCINPAPPIVFTPPGPPQPPAPSPAPFPVPPVTPPSPVPPTPPVPVPVPLARAYIYVWTDGFVTPVTAGSRIIAKDAAINSLEWQSVNAEACEGNGFVTGGAIAGQINNQQATLQINPGQTKDFAIRCKNTEQVWSAWQVVQILKEDDVSAGPNRPPTAPVIWGADEHTVALVSGTVNQTIPFTFKAVDPDGDNLLYRIDWDANGVVDTILPLRGFVRSATPLTHNNIWFASGTYVFRVQARDEQGNLSPWASHTIRIDIAPNVIIRPLPPQITLETERNLVRASESTTVRLRVLADYELTCTVYGVAGGSDTFTHLGGAETGVYQYETDPLSAMQLLRAVCIPQIPGVVMATEVREGRVGVVPPVQER